VSTRNPPFFRRGRFQTLAIAWPFWCSIRFALLLNHHLCRTFLRGLNLLREHNAALWKRFYPCLHFLGFVVTDPLEQPYAFCGMLTRIRRVMLLQGNVC